jgi:4-hydroxyphenylpyruvate dioxygenase
VQLWRQGDARVLVNHGDDRTHGDPLVVALGLESADPAGSAARAEAQMASALPRRRGPGEADLTAVAAPDGTSVFFCRTGAGGDGWLGDFLELEPGRDGEGAVRAIDHVVLSQPFDYFDEAALFYRSVLGLRPEETQDVAGPEGLLRSRSLSDPSGRLRLALTVPRLGGEHGALGVLQHVAFASDDALEAARRMREHGVPLLEVPGNYYEDLAARTELDDDLLAEMRELGVLYDADERGELLHFFTRLIGDRLFLEVAERRGGYDGYGAANSPVRLASQHREAVEHA